MPFFSKSFKVNNFLVGEKYNPLIIAEVAQAHDGSLGFAHSFIDLVHEAGADAIKFQTHIAEAESTLDEPFRIKFSKEDKTRFEYWKRMEFSFEEWLGLKKHADEKGLIFLSSPFSIEAFELLNKIDIPAWKIASGEVSNFHLLKLMASTEKPILLSSGMSSYNQIDNVFNFLEHIGVKDLGIFQCTTRYPTPYEEIGLNVIDDFKSKYEIPVGLSDHSGDIIPSIVAMGLGASMIEVHIAFHDGQFGPDTIASLNPSKLKELCRARNVIKVLKNNNVNKNTMAKKLEKLSSLFGKSIALKKSQPAGTIITRQM